MNLFRHVTQNLGLTALLFVVLCSFLEQNNLTISTVMRLCTKAGFNPLGAEAKARRASRSAPVLPALKRLCTALPDLCLLEQK